MFLTPFLNKDTIAYPNRVAFFLYNVPSINPNTIVFYFVMYTRAIGVGLQRWLHLWRTTKTHQKSRHRERSQYRLQYYVSVFFHASKKVILSSLSVNKSKCNHETPASIRIEYGKRSLFCTINERICAAVISLHKTSKAHPKTCPERYCVFFSLTNGQILQRKPRWCAACVFIVIGTFNIFVRKTSNVSRAGVEINFHAPSPKRSNVCSQTSSVIEKYLFTFLINSLRVIFS